MGKVPRVVALILRTFPPHVRMPQSAEIVILFLGYTHKPTFCHQSRPWSSLQACKWYYFWSSIHNLWTKSTTSAIRLAHNVTNFMDCLPTVFQDDLCTFATFSSIVLVDGCPEQLSSSTDIWSFLKCLYQ